MNANLASVSLFVSSLLLASGLVAQTTTTIKTDTVYGVAAAAGTASGHDSKPANTAITSTTPLRVTARAGSSHASSSVYAYGNGMSVYEYASVYISSKSTTTTDSAGTTTDKTGNIGDAHTVSANIGATASTIGQMVLYWTPNLNGKGIVTKAVVNVDGKDVATFTELDAAQTKRVDVTVGATGIALKITTNASAAPGAAGRSYYSTSVRAYFQPNVTSSSCTFTAFGKTCGNEMKGSALTLLYTKVKYHQATLTISGMDREQVGLMAIGDILTSPVTLPAGGCLLLVNPVIIVPVRNSTRVLFRNQDPFTANMQAVTFKLSGSGITIGAANGLTVKCPKL
ncbi:MAG: hypothetical protein ACYTF5_08385 [Planctomycetota bacterium]|jgi:hypothetical protein